MRPLTGCTFSRAAIAAPSGMAPNMLIICINDPGPIPDPNQPGSAGELLIEVDGVVQVDPLDHGTLRVSYHLLELSLEQIETGLMEMGLHLDNRLIYRLKRTLHYYTEETQRANQGCRHGDSNCTRRIFAGRYRLLDHNCRDSRPEHWRKYL